VISLPGDIEVEAAEEGGTQSPDPAKSAA
jgi:hypothetical protein